MQLLRILIPELLLNNKYANQMNRKVFELWPELEWINDPDLREKTAQTWEFALDRSVLSADDLKRIPFTLLIPGLDVNFMAHKKCVVHIARDCGRQIQEFLGNALQVNMDHLIAGAILADVGKLLEYEIVDGKVVQGKYGQYIRHPFSGVSLAEEAGVPPEVCHIIAAHADEGNLVKRSVEAYIVHYADFMTYLPFKDRLRIE